MNYTLSEGCVKCPKRSSPKRNKWDCRLDRMIIDARLPSSPDIHHQAATVLHPRISRRAEPEPVAFALPEEPGSRVGGRDMPVVTARCARAAHARIPAAAFRQPARTVPGDNAHVGRPGGTARTRNCRLAPATRNRPDEFRPSSGVVNRAIEGLSGGDAPP